MRHPTGLELVKMSTTTCRVHLNPARPLRMPVGYDHPHRFDDPDDHYAVFYVGEDLYACLVEVFGWWRRHAPSSARVAAVVGADDETWPPPENVIDLGWLMQQKRAEVVLIDGDTGFVDVTLPRNLSILNEHADIQRALEHSLGPGVDLDEATIRLAGARGRSVTQTLSRVVHEMDPPIGGIRYTSRLDSSAACFAIFEETAYRFQGPAVPLDLHHLNVQAAVGRAAGALRLTLPAGWDA